MADWTEEQFELLKQHDATGLSFTEIAKIINRETGSRFSRNSCIGKSFREGLARRGRGFQPVNVDRGAIRREAVRRQKLNGEIKYKPRRSKVSLPPLHIVEAEPPRDFLHLTISQLELHQCRYIHGEGRTATYCGQPVADFSPSYCGHHHRLCYTRPQDRQMEAA